MASEFKPGRAYWKEVDALDAQVRALSVPHPTGKPHALRRFMRHTIWAHEDRDSFAYHKSTKIGLSGLSSIVLCEVQSVDPLSEGLPQVDYSTKVGVFGKTLTYFTGTIVLKRMLMTDYGHIPDISNIDKTIASNQESRRIDEQSGVILPTEEDFALLLEELKIGASGTYLINPDPQHGIEE